MRRDERLQALHLERTTAVLENISYELRVHTADEFLILVEQIVVLARGEVELHCLLVDDGVQAGIVEMFV
ncbi:MAG: hypothetical protein ACRDT7_05140 [Microbacterium sp.]